MQPDRPFIGILLMLAFCVLAPLADAIAKLLGDVIPLAMLVLARFAIQAAILLPIVLWLGQDLKLPKGTLWFTWIRTALQILGIGLMFTALKYLPLADALAIAFVMPFIMLVLGHYVLNETVGLHRAAACGVGFIGTLLVIQPNLVEVGAPALLPLGVALIFALFMMVTRKIAKDIPPIKLQAISGIQATVVLIPFVAFGPTNGITEFGTQGLGLLLLLGVIGTIAHLAMTASLRFAPASTLAPMQYLEIPFGTCIGWLVFKDLPNGLAAIGIVVTICAGLYIVIREQRLSQASTDGTTEPSAAHNRSPAE